jgi:hypothetical protein
MRVGRRQMDRVSDSALRRQLLSAMERQVDDFRSLADGEKDDFVQQAITEARSWGLLTAQGIAAYALGLWFLDPDFPQESALVQALLRSNAPEVRKVHAMNEWISAKLGRPEDPAAADNALRHAYTETAAWGPAS